MFDSKQIFSIQSEEDFQNVALEVFRYQAQENEVYKNFLNFLNVDYYTVKHTNEIPFLPIQFFKKFELISGKEQLKEYFHTPNKARVFCQNCASPIYSYRTDLPNILRLRLGTVTEGTIPAATEEFFCEHKPNFIELR